MKIALPLTLALALAGCSNQPLTQEQALANVQKQVTKVCAVVQPALSSMQGMTANFTADQLADLGKAQSAADKVCNASTTDIPDIPNIKDLAQNAVPDLIHVVQTSKLSDDDKGKLTFGIIAAQALLNQALAQ